VLILHACMLNLHVCVFNRHAVWYEYNATQCVNSTRMSGKITRIIVQFKSQTECQNHSQHHMHDVKFTLVRVVRTQSGIFWYSYVNFSWFVLKSHTSCWNSTCSCFNHSRKCQNHTHTCPNHTLRVEITLVCVEITVLTVEITLVRVTIILRVEIILCV
jgi:hypothetical protein